jgi:hypothetical protein
MSNGKKALPYEVIMSAISGDAESVNYVLEYYDPYIKMEVSMTKWMSS